MRHPVPLPYREPLLGPVDRRLQMTLILSSAIGLVVLLAVALAPLRVVEPMAVDEVPERLAKLIIEKKEPEPITPPAPVVAELPPMPEVVPEEPVPEPTPEAKPELAVKPDPKPARRREPTPKLAEDRGQAGREKAKEEVAKTLAGTTQSVSTALADLSDALSSTKKSDEKPRKARSRRGVRGGRNSATGKVDHAGMGDIGQGDDVQLVSAGLIDIEAMSDGSNDLASADPSVAAGGAGVVGAYRSNASLLAVVRRYAAGIQFCYDNELKKQPSLEGKMVVVITVQPSGQVSEVTVANDSLGSGRLQECVLGQIREWKFPAIEGGVVSFRAPFVFTPPG